MGQQATGQMIEKRNSFFTNLVQMSIELQTQIQDTLSENETDGAQMAIEVLASSAQRFDQMRASEDDPIATEV